MKNKLSMKRALAWLLTIIMIFTMLPMNTLANEDNVNVDCTICAEDYTQCEYDSNSILGLDFSGETQTVSGSVLNLGIAPMSGAAAETFTLYYSSTSGKLHQGSTGGTEYPSSGDTWSGSGDTLTLLEGFEFITSANTALVMPPGTTLLVEGNSAVTNTGTGTGTITGIECSGQGSGTFTIDVTQGKTLTVTVENGNPSSTTNYAIHATTFTTGFIKKGKGTLTTTVADMGTDGTTHCVKTGSNTLFTMEDGTFNINAGTAATSRGINTDSLLNVTTNVFSMTGGVLNVTAGQRAIFFASSTNSGEISGGTIKAIATNYGALPHPLTNITNAYWCKTATDESALTSASWASVNAGTDFTDSSSKAVIITFTEPTNYTLYLDNYGNGLSLFNNSGIEYTEGKGLTWSVDDATATLTLNGFDFTTTADIALQIIDNPATIKLMDGTTNTITSTHANGIGISADDDLTIQGHTAGTGTLTATGTVGGVEVESNELTMIGGTLTAIAEDINSSGIYAESISMTGGTIYAITEVGGDSIIINNEPQDNLIIMGNNGSGYNIPAEFYEDGGEYCLGETGNLNEEVYNARITVPADYPLFYSKDDGKLRKDNAVGDIYEGEGTTWSGNGAILTLKGFNFTTTASTGLYINDDVTVVIEDGSVNSITSTGDDFGIGCGIEAAQSLIVRGEILNNGTLAATGYSSGLLASSGTFTMEGGILTATGNPNVSSYGLNFANYSVFAMTGGTINASGGYSAVRASGTTPVVIIMGKSGGSYSVPAQLTSDGYVKTKSDNTVVTDAKITVPADYTLYYKEVSSIWGLYKNDTTDPYPADSTWSVDGDNNLMLNGFSFTTTAANGLVMAANKTIVASGDNTIASEYSGSVSTNAILCLAGDLIIDVAQNATLTATVANATGAEYQYGIYAQYSFTKNGLGTLNAISGNNATNTSGIITGSGMGSFTMNGGTINATGGNVPGSSYGIYAMGSTDSSYKFNMKSGTINANAGTSGNGNSIGIRIRYEDLDMTGGTINATGNNYGISIEENNGNFKITGGTIIANGETNAMSVKGTTTDAAEVSILGASSLDGTYDIPAQFDSGSPKTIKATSGADINYAKIRPIIDYTLHFNTADGKLYKNYSNGTYGQEVTVSGIEGYQHPLLGWILLLDGADFSTTAATALVLPTDTFISVVSDSTIESTNTDSSTNTTYGIDARASLEISVYADETLTVTTGDATIASNATRYGIKTTGSFTGSGAGTINAAAGNAEGSGFSNKSYGIRSGGAGFFAKGANIIAKGGNVSSNNDNSHSVSYGISTTDFTSDMSGTVTATGGDGNEKSESYGIMTTGSFNLSKGTVTAASGVGIDSRALFIFNGGFSVEGGTLIAAADTTGDSNAISYGINVTDYTKEFNVTGGRIFVKGATPVFTSAALASGTSLFVRGMGTTNYTEQAAFIDEYGCIQPASVTDARITSAVTRSTILDFTVPTIPSYIDVNGNEITQAATGDDILDSGEGWEWYVSADGSDPRLNNAIGKVLLLDGLQLKTTDGFAIKVPDNTTIVVISDSYAGCPDSDYGQNAGISVAGKLTVDVNESVSLTVESGTDEGNTSMGLGITGDFKKKGKGTLNATVTNAGTYAIGILVTGSFTMDAGKIIAVTNALGTVLNNAMIVGGTIPTSGVDIKGYGSGSYSVEAQFGNAEAVPGVGLPAHKTIKADDTVVTNAQLTVVPTYTVTFNANGGSCTTASATTKADGKLTSLPTPTKNGYTFNGWFTAASSGTKITTSTVFTMNTTIYAQWTVNTPSGGNYIPAPTQKVEETIKVETNGTSSYTATVKDTTLIAEVPVKTLNDSIDKLLKELEETPDKVQNIEIKVSGAPNKVDTAEFKLPIKAIASIVEKTDAQLSVNAGKLGTLVFDNDALAAIIGTGSGDLRIVTEDITKTMDTENKLTDAQKATIGSNPVYDFSVFVGNTKVSDFGLGTVTISLPYAPKIGENRKGIVVCYVDEEGNKKVIENSKYDALTKGMTFTTNHFSLYMISNMLTVTYKANGGGKVSDIPSDTALYDSGEKVTVIGIPISTSKFFAGWNTKADGTGILYTAGKTFTITEDITLYAQWRDTITSKAKITYKVTGKYEVVCIGTTAKNAKTITIADTFLYKGITYKVTSITKNAFRGNEKVTTVIIGNNVKTINNTAFYKCPNLKNVTIGTGLVTLNNDVFCHAKDGLVITINSTKLTTMKTAVNHGIKNMVIKVPESKLDAYKKLFAEKSKTVTVKAK